jgi:2-polyprenyl-6-hydroxyphenyl methylase/3-demethylubiquinone-9 3-methyltransferase
VNNDLYATLGERWYEAQDDPVALLRAEARLRNPWVARHIGEAFGEQPCDVLDIDENSLRIAASHDTTGTVRYEMGDALSLPYGAESFDVACGMDFLEHVEDPRRVIQEVARVLRPSGLFFFHTFNRNPLAWLVVIKGVEWFVRNTPRDLHVLRLFLKPEEVTAMCRAHGLAPLELVGSRPRFGRAFFEMLRTHVVPADFEFTFTGSTTIAYTGFARKTKVG